MFRIITALVTIFPIIASGALPLVAETTIPSKNSLSLTTPSRYQIQFLTYLVECALPENAHLDVTLHGERMSFSGGLGLAPEWNKRALSEKEQRWVSACLLARANYYGKRVQISMRSANPAHSALRTSVAERERFVLFEGGFYGNLFSDAPTGYVCAPKQRSLDPAPVSQDRVCTEASGRTLNDGSAITRCGFVRQVFCDGVEDAGKPHGPPVETIFVYLELPQS